jgi:hypothetical protein
MCFDPSPRPAFTSTVGPFRHKVRLIKRRSQEALRDSSFARGSYHFVYIDGDHRAASVLTGAVLSFPLLVRHGIMIFDDYLLESDQPDVPQTMPKIAIDAFLNVFSRRVRVLHREWQVAIEKL